VQQQGLLAYKQNSNVGMLVFGFLCLKVPAGRTATSRTSCCSRIHQHSATSLPMLTWQLAINVSVVDGDNIKFFFLFLTSNKTR